MGYGSCMLQCFRQSAENSAGRNAENAIFRVPVYVAH